MRLRLHPPLERVPAVGPGYVIQRHHQFFPHARKNKSQVVP